MNFSKPHTSTLESIEVELRIVYAKLGFVPKAVRLAGQDPDRSGAAWRNEALRFYYCVVRKGLDPTRHNFIELLPAGADPNDPIDYENLAEQDLWALKKGRNPDDEPLV